MRGKELHGIKDTLVLLTPHFLLLFQLVAQIRPGGMMLIHIKVQEEWVPVCRAHFVHKSLDGTITDEFKKHMGNDGQPLQKLKDQLQYWRYQFTPTPPTPYYEPPYS